MSLSDAYESIDATSLPSHPSTQTVTARDDRFVPAPLPSLAIVISSFALISFVAACSDKVAGPSAGGPEPIPTPCSSGPCVSATLPYDSLKVIALPTYDGSGQVVHPDYATTPPSWEAYQRHLIVTPYPNGDATKELPSAFVSTDGVAWGLEPGAPNPVVTVTRGILSDPDQLYVPEFRELWVYYRLVTDSNLIRLIRSPDGVHWTSPVPVVGAPNHLIISPSIVRRGASDWWMWSINGGSGGCGGPSTTVELRQSTDGQHWSPPITTTLVQPGFFPWHIDVEWIPSRHEFWALYNGKEPGGCATRAIFMATSANGTQWTTYPSPVLTAGAIPAFRDIVYRSSFLYDSAADEVMLWFSGARYDGGHYVWHAAVQKRHRADLFRQVERVSPRLRGDRVVAGPPEPGVEF